jgi:hypothetical protein
VHDIGAVVAFALRDEGFRPVEGRTSTGVPVYNVAMPLLLQKFPGRPPFRVVELEAAPASETAAALEIAAKSGSALQPPIGSSTQSAKT